MNILLSLSVAFAVGLLSTRLMKLVNLPNITGYLIAGLIIGPSCFGLITNDGLAALEIIPTIALGFIAFSIGAEFKLKNLKEIGGKVVVITLFQALAAVLFVDLALILLASFGVIDCSISVAIVLGAIAAATAPAATLMVIRQYKARGPVVETLLPVVAFDDAVGLIIFSISIALAKVFDSGVALTFNDIVLAPLAEIAFSLVVGVAIGLILMLGTRVFKSKNNRLILALLAVFAGCGLSEILHLSSLLVCMMIGAIFTNTCKDDAAVLDSCDEWTVPLLMIFFVLSGAQLNIALIPSIGLVGIIYIVFRSLGKYFGSLAGCKIVKAHPNVTKYLGLTLMPQAGVEIGMAQMAMVALPLALGQEINTVVLCAVFVYALLGPILTKIALTKAGEIHMPPKKVKSKPPTDAQ